MNEYIKIDVKDYVKKGIETGILFPIEAEKVSRIKAKKGKIGEYIITWSEDEEGNELIEKENIVKSDKITNEPDWVVTKIDEEENEIIDKNGHLNQWIINDTMFKKKYKKDEKNIDLYCPIGGIQIFVQIPNNIILNQWGSDMKIASGGYINITNPNDMYGISERDFTDTYKFINRKNKELTRKKTS